MFTISQEDLAYLLELAWCVSSCCGYRDEVLELLKLEVDRGPLFEMFRLQVEHAVWAWADDPPEVFLP